MINLSLNQQKLRVNRQLKSLKGTKRLNCLKMMILRYQVKDGPLAIEQA